jgi:hypothetical protein
VSLADLIDPRAVEAALSELDHLGREAFLDRYGFGRARKYSLVWNGRRYDSKAIVGAAHGYEFPLLGPLAASGFSEGELTVARKLRSPGFEVLAVGGSAGPGTWAFCVARSGLGWGSARHCVHDVGRWNGGRAAAVATR